MGILLNATNQVQGANTPKVFVELSGKAEKNEKVQKEKRMPFIFFGLQAKTFRGIKTTNLLTWQERNQRMN